MSGLIAQIASQIPPILNSLKQDAMELLTLYPCSNSQIHNLLGLYSPGDHRGYIMRQLMYGYNLDAITQPVDDKHRLRNIMLTDQSHVDLNDQDVTIQLLHLDVQTQIQQFTEHLKSIINIKGEIQQAELARITGTTLKDAKGNGSYFLYNIGDILQSQGIIEFRHQGKPKYYRVKENKTYQFQPSLNTFRYSSKYEAAIANYLTKYNIKFIHQARYKDCKDKKHLPFDFYLIDYDILIEVDGEQHRKFIPHFHRTEEGFLLTQKHDTLKNDFCVNNEIKLLRIICNQDSKITDFKLTYILNSMIQSNYCVMQAILDDD